MRLRYGYLLSGIVTGMILLFSFLFSLPDGKLHVIFCDVGQGDAIYIRFPDGRDGLVDGGPSAKRVISCLSRHMPFWDRTIDIVVNTHPQKDHIEGLIEVMKRYAVEYIVTDGIDPGSELYTTFTKTTETQKAHWKHVVTGDIFTIGKSKFEILWPSQDILMQGNASYASMNSRVLGATTPSSSFDLNNASVVMMLSYGTFDVLLTGDADRSVQDEFMNKIHQNNPIEILKVPHHGSKTGLLDRFLDQLQVHMAVISVGKNSYGHPAPELIKMLTDRNIDIHQTDNEGDIEVVSDGTNWRVISNKDK